MTQCETGEQLFESLLNKASCSEIKNKNSLKLDTKIFTSEFEFGDVLEISGKTQSAKSELILNLIGSFLLPGKWIVDVKVENEIKKVQIDLNKWSFFPELTNNQLKLKVILIENDLKFCILKLFSILENRIKNCIKLKQQAGDSLSCKITRSNLEIFLKSCLSNLLVYKCNSSEQFLLTLASCEYSIKQEQQQHVKQQNFYNFFMPIFIDSINSNFEFIDSLLLNSVDHTEKFTISLLNRILTKYKNYVVIIASRIEYEPSTNKYETNTYSYSKWQKCVTKKIKLSRLANSEDFHLINNLNDEYLFRIGNNGFAFTEI
jgi:hypothetical protein